MVMQVLDHSIDVLVLNLGVVKRVYCNVSFPHVCGRAVAGLWPGCGRAVAGLWPGCGQTNKKQTDRINELLQTAR